MSARFIHLAFIFAFFCAVAAKSHRQELCQLIQTSTDTSITELGTEMSTIVQDSCVKYFSLDLSNPSFKNKYVIVEVDFIDFPNLPTLRPKFLQKMGSKPKIYSNNKENTNNLDSNAFWNRKIYHHITLSPEETNSGKISYFALYKASSVEEKYYEDQIKYTINVRTSDTHICPQDCSGNGICNQSQGKCVCNEGFFDLDCSVQASPLTLEEANNQSINSNQWRYFYFRINNNMEDIKLILGKTEGSVKLSFHIKNQQTYFLPNFFHSEGSYTLAPQQNNLQLSILRPLLSQNIERQLVIGAYNIDNEPINVSIQIGLYDRDAMSSTDAILIAIGAFLGLLVILTTVVFIKYRNTRREGEWLEENQEAKKVFLTKDEVEKYFPKTKFNALKSPFPQTLCSICLEDFSEDSNCRQLYCEHIYHDACIETWVTSHDNCPNCKKSMTKEAITAHLSTPDQEQNLKEQEITEDCNHIMIPIKDNITNLSTQQLDNEQENLLNSLNRSLELGSAVQIEN